MPESRESLGLYRSRIIRGKDRLTVIYHEGAIIRSPSVLLRYLFEPIRYQEKEPVQVAFTISRRAGNAVRRNQIRRWMRESFRKKLPDLKTIQVPEYQTLSVVLSYRGTAGTGPNWNDIGTSVDLVIGRLVALSEKGFTARH